MRHDAAFYTDLFLIFYVAFLFAVMTLQMARRSRFPDGLSYALISLFATLSFIYTLTGLAFAGVIPRIMPDWTRWVYRLMLAASGTAVIIFLAVEEKRRHDA